ncbi:MAG: DMT family transporter [Ignavibacteriales bacterium]
MAFVGVTWGLNHAVIKHALATFQPLAFTSMRLGAGSLALLFILLLVERDIRLERRDILPAIAVGLLGHTMYQLFYIAGVNRSTVGTTAIICALSPTMVAVIEQCAGIRRYALRGWAGIAASLCGVALITLAGKAGGVGNRGPGGELLVLLCTLCWAGYTVMTRPLLERYSPLKVTTLTMAIGTIPLLGLAPPALLSQDWGAVAPSAWMGLGLSCCFAIVIGYVLWSWGIQRIGSGRTAIYANLSPLAGSIGGWLLLGETWAPAQVAGAVLVLLGVSQVRAGSRPGVPAAHRSRGRCTGVHRPEVDE